MTPSTDIDALVRDLRIKSDMINMGERIRWGTETALMDQAASALTALQAERDAAQFAARNGRSLSEDSIHAIRELLNKAGVPKAPWVDDHVGNAIVQRNEAVAAREAAEASLAQALSALKPFAEWCEMLDAEFSDHDDSIIVGGLNGVGVTFGDLRTARALTTHRGSDHG